MAGESLDDDFIANLLKQDATKKRGGPRKDPTAERTQANWFKQNYHLNSRCEIEECHDVRTTVHDCSKSSKFHMHDCTGCEEIEDRGRQVTATVGGIEICRYCFLAGEGK